jgi:hypothetical protein
MKCTLRIVIWLRTDRSHEMSVQGSGPLRFETGVIEGDIMKFSYAPSHPLDTSWCYTSDIYYTYVEWNQESSESGNIRHHCRNGHSLKRWYTHNRYTVKIHVGNVLKTITVVLIFIWYHHCHPNMDYAIMNLEISPSTALYAVINIPKSKRLYVHYTVPTNRTAATFQECCLAGGVGCKRLALHGNWCTTTVCI